MPRYASITRERILEAAHRAFFRQGFSRVTMSDIAGAARLTKRTLYQHFDSKDALLEAMLEQQHRESSRVFSENFAVTEDTPQALVRRVFEDIGAWSSSKTYVGSGFTRLACELGDLRGHPAMQLARRHKATIETRLAQRLAELGVEDPARLAREIMMLMEGAMVALLLHADQDYASAAGRAAQTLVCHATGTATP